MSISMSAALESDVSNVFRDSECETQLLRIMAKHPDGLWNVSALMRLSGLARARVDRALTGLEAGGLVQADLLGRSKVVRYRPGTGTA
jgi:DNA-binding IclR family transcriptional regulator